MNVQSTSPYYAKNAYWCIGKTMESEGLSVKSYHLEVPAFGDWGFHMASASELQKKHPVPEDTRYLSEDNFEAMFIFGKDEKAGNIEVNHLTKPVLIQYYNDAVKDWE